MPALVPVAHPDRRRRHHAADAPGVDQGADGLVAGAQERVGRAADAQPALACGGQHFGAGCRIDGKGLLAVDVLAGLQRRQVHRRVCGRHCQVEDRLDVVAREQVVDLHHLQPELGADALRGIAIDVRTGDQVQHRVVRCRLQVGGADLPAADQTDAYRIDLVCGACHVRYRSPAAHRKPRRINSSGASAAITSAWWPSEL